MTAVPFEIRFMGDACLFVRPSISDKPIDFAFLAERLMCSPPAWLRDVVPTPNVLAVYFCPIQLAQDSLATADGAQLIRQWLSEVLRSGPANTTEVRHHRIPVIYGGRHGEDLAELAKLLQVSEPELVALHCQAQYRVAMTGFRPGFAYITGLPPQLHIPRRDKPRVRVPAGSVALGGGYTGIYPSGMPGGWHLIGQTDIPLFNVSASPPSLLRTGDVVEFVPSKEGVLP